jgi:hypothetical protein
MTDKNEITYDRDGNAVSFSGPDAVAVFHAAALRSGLARLIRERAPERLASVV